MSDPKLDELRLPMAVLNRLVKSVLPSGAALSKDARTKIMRACSVFILFILSQAEEHAASKKRKTVNVEDVMFVLNAFGFVSITESLREAFESYKATRPVKTFKAKGARRSERAAIVDSTKESDQSNVVEG
ncbi:unnamed protein product [Heligmosomoides polygyrus]|uniref:DNA polymerase epsilon subunit 3 n=1 Tax=Heligmosomoides polygyrus TaxID=6339 RepID=A0A183GGI5_HELPZ|nr:unnamed protein product [Heligmosomoides polygyrus]